MTLLEQMKKDIASADLAKLKTVLSLVSARVKVLEASPAEEAVAEEGVEPTEEAVEEPTEEVAEEQTEEAVEEPAEEEPVEEPLPAKKAPAKAPVKTVKPPPQPARPKSAA